MLEESARIIPRMWREEEFAHQSALIDIPPRPIIPKPYQQPHPPMYLACSRESTLNQAGEWGLGALVLGFAGPEDIEQKNRVYRAAVKRRTPTSQIPEQPVEHLSALCPAIVLDDGAKARAIGHRGQRFFTEAIRHWYNPGPDAPPPRTEIADMSDEDALRLGRRAPRRLPPRAEDRARHRGDGPLQPEPRLRHRRRRDALCRAAGRRGRRRGDVPDPDGNGAAGGRARDDPPARREGDPALPLGRRLSPTASRRAVRRPVVGDTALAQSPRARSRPWRRRPAPSASRRGRADRAPGAASRARSVGLEDVDRLAALADRGLELVPPALRVASRGRPLRRIARRASSSCSSQSGLRFGPALRSASTKDASLK